jgi:Domain of unknown function (DUF4381)
MSADGPVLRDIHLPHAAWWPPAPGWWLLALMLALAAAAGVWWLRRRARLRPLRAALREIDHIEGAFPNGDDRARFAAACSQLLRRVARRIEPGAASLYGERWRTFLHVHAPGEAAAAPLDALLDAPFRADPALDAESLLGALRTWCLYALRRRGRRATVEWPAHPHGAEAEASALPESGATAGSP